jgi:hypothetical protein
LLGYIRKQGWVGVAGFTRCPVSTTHVVSGGIAGTMVASGAGLHRETLPQITWASSLDQTSERGDQMKAALIDGLAGPAPVPSDSPRGQSGA